MTNGRTLRMTPRQLLGGSFVAIVVLLLLTARTTQARAAGLITGCPAQQLSQPFSPWLDLSNYTLVGDGGFESGASGWSLKGGASVVSGNEPWHVRGAADTRSLNLPSGALATSPAFCVDLTY